jgi:hypothetical protein
MMDLNAIRKRLDDERRYLARDGEVVEVRPCLTRVVNGRQRMVAWSSLTETNADEVIADELAQHRAADGEFEWKLYSHDQPADLQSRLERHGLVAGEPEAVMVYDLHQGPPAGERDDSVVRRITEPAHIDYYRRVAEAVSDRKQDFICEALAAGLSSRSTQHLGYVVSLGSEPISIGRLYTHPPKRIWRPLWWGHACRTSRARVLPRRGGGARSGRDRVGSAISARGCTSNEPTHS